MIRGVVVDRFLDRGFFDLPDFSDRVTIRVLVVAGGPVTSTTRARSEAAIQQICRVASACDAAAK